MSFVDRDGAGNIVVAAEGRGDHYIVSGMKRLGLCPADRVKRNLVCVAILRVDD